MNSSKKILIGLIFMLAGAPADALCNDHHGDNRRAGQMQNAKERTRARLELRETLRDRERCQILFQDCERMHNMLQQSELRGEMLKSPRFMRQMMQNGDMRRELLHNEQMMQAMLRNRDIHREINRNPKMMEELEKIKTYRQLNQDHQADILEELLTELTMTGVFSQRR